MPAFARLFRPLSIVAPFALRLLLIAVGGGAGQAARAQLAAPEQALMPVLVSASRFPDADTAPIGATVISAEQIRQSGADNVNQAIRTIAGVVSHQSLSGTSDFSLDLRGFGVTADQNLVILVDGIRLSENEQTVALLSSIPIETVERIEIVRGGSSVLYGEGATGGTIQVITKRLRNNGVAETHGTLVADAGSYGRLGLRAAATRSWDGWSLDVNRNHLETDNFRDNNRLRQDNISGGLQWADASSRIGVRIDSSDQQSGFPGGLTMAKFLDNPHSASTPTDFGKTRVNRALLFGEQRIGAFELATELSQRDKTAVARFGTFDTTARSRTTQFSPRIRHSAEFGDMRNELVAGFDFQESDRHTEDSGTLAVGTQRSRAVYARDEIRSGEARLAFGMRREKFDKSNHDPLSLDPTSNYGQSQALTAWDLQGSVVPLPKTTVFAKAGRSYRVANIDDNASTLHPGQILLPQTSNDLALGTTFGGPQQALTATLFQHNLHNEIMFNPTAGAFGTNVNLDPTLRRGVELEMRSQWTNDLVLSASLQHVDARFTEGPNNGKEVVLVPRNSASARLNWISGSHSVYGAVKWVASQRYGSDFTNTCTSRMPAYATLDARYALRIERWEFALTGTNLANKNYFSQAFGCESGIYPDAGRQLVFSGRYDF